MNLNLGLMKDVVARKLGPKVGRVGLVLSKHSPEILLGVGVAGAVVATVMACKATLKVNEVTEEANLEMFEKIRKAAEEHATPDGREYSEQDAKRDMAIAYIQRTAKIAKLYVPAVLVGTASVGCILASHGLMRKRNLAVIAAYAMVKDQFDAYAKRVIEEYGEEKDRQFRTGVHVEEREETTVNAKGKEVKEKVKVDVVNTGDISQYQQVFGPEYTDENGVKHGSTQWRQSRADNEYFLYTVELFANDTLKARGHIFLNEVLDHLGLPRTKAGQVVGWVRNSQDGDGFVDIGYKSAKNAPVWDDTYGYNSPWVLDFNVDGIVFDLI